MSIQVEFDWVEAAPSTDKLAQSTMAALTINVHGRPVTSVLDHRTRSCRNHVVTPLAYVAEWLVGNWWRLFHEVGDETMPRPDFADAHDLSYVGEGFLLPSLTIVPTPSKMRLRWHRYRPANSGIEFTAGGEAHVDRQDLGAAFSVIVEAVQDRLADGGLESELLQHDWTAIQAADEDERAFCRATALAGHDPYEMCQQLAGEIIEFGRSVAPALRDDALATADGASLAPLARWLSDAMEGVHTATAGNTWTGVRSALPVLSAPQPYQRGYDLAQFVRAQLGPLAPGYEFKATGGEALPWVDLRPPPTPRIQGLVAANSPACATAARGNGKRFSSRPRPWRLLGASRGRAGHPKWAGHRPTGAVARLCRRVPRTSCVAKGTASTYAHTPR